MTECVKTRFSDPRLRILGLPRVAFFMRRSCRRRAERGFRRARRLYPAHGGERALRFAHQGGINVQDNPECVRLNRQKLFRAFGMREDAVIVPKQVHGDVMVACENRADCADVALRAQDGADGVIVSCDEVGAMLCFADCVAGHRGFSASHLRRRACRLARRDGAYRQSAVSASVEGRRRAVLSQRLYGPHIHACHFEVGEDAPFCERIRAERLTDDKPRFASAALRCGLTSLGVDERRIADAGVCTRMRRRKTLFFVSSERRTVWQACRVAVRCGRKRGLDCV
ncbi:MAG: laccase domain-containing protein [Eggerthellaceae bacterium]